MVPSRIDVTQLTPGEIVTILERYEMLVQVMTASNNTLLTKLANCPDCGDAARAILNDWSTFTNNLFAIHTADVEMAGNVRSGRGSPSGAGKPN
jgi:hypothetical protein